ncbi:MAG: 30S ribosomal protein S20 [Candidatus Eisenbacteria bacterium]|uniref:Small ribosomal subunit protein bS20 n=1 Tax=Eiseniibacteriota bacterium TaxID=2212470 RepID=A0A938BQW5_UNCEI|nr:30S ribosomal protein S20 [Candidatus Eisenbacteria bacterium]
MPQHKAQWKSVRRSEKQRERNRQARARVRTSLRKLDEAEPQEKPELLRQASSVLDVAVRKGVLKKTTADRRKSRLARAVNRAAGQGKSAG